MTLKFDSTGTLSWAKTIGGPQDEFNESVALASDGGYVLVANTFSYGLGNPNPPEFYDTLFVKLDSSGNCSGCSMIASVTPTVSSQTPTVSNITLVVTSPTLTVSSQSLTAVSQTPTVSTQCSGTTTFNPLTVTSSGRIGIGTTSPMAQLDVAGTIKATGLCFGTSCYSSMPESPWTRLGNDIIYNTGGVSIGASSLKGTKLFVADTNTGTTASASFSIRSSYTTGSVASISATSLTSGNVLQLTVPASTSGGGAYLLVKDTTGAVYASLSSGGRFSIRRSMFSRGAATTNCTTVGAGCIDYAENFHTLDNSIEAGDVIALDPASDSQDIIKAKTGDILLGVISSNPGVLLRGNTVRVGTADSNESITEDYNNGFRPVALAGRVPVKISFENGDIKKGDYLTSSSIPGKAAKAIKQGRVIGIALESAAQDSNKTQVMVLINPHYAGQELDINGQLADFSGLPAVLQNNPGLIDAVLAYLKDAILTVKKLIADTIETNSIETKKGVTTFDKQTGEPFCIEVLGGEIKAVKGKCDEPVSGESGGLNPESGETPPPSSPEPETSPGQTPEPSPTPELVSPSITPGLTPTPEITPTPEATPVPEEIPPTPEPETSQVTE